jgi:hypothetical protein
MSLICPPLVDQKRGLAKVAYARGTITAAELVDCVRRRHNVQ